MKHNSKLNRSRWLLLTLFTLIVGISPAWGDTLTEDFESLTVDGTTLSNGWFVQGTNGYGAAYLLNPSVINNFSDAYNYSYELCKQGRSGRSIVTSKASNPAYIVIPVELTGTVRFYAASYKTSNGSCNVFEVTEDGGVYTIGSTSLTGGAVSLPKKSSSSASPTWQEISVELGSDHKMIAITMTYGALDDFVGEKYVYTPYQAPASISVVPSETSAIITWTAGATEETVTAWNLEYKKSSDDVWSEVHGIAAGTLSQEISGLNDNTNYDVRVKAIYGTEESVWKTTTFKTPRAPITSFPWSEDFTGLTSGNIPDGWDNTEGTTTYASYKWTYNNSGNTAAPCLRFDSYNNSKNNTNFLKTPVMSFTQNAPMQLKFWYKNPKGGDFSVYISNDGGATYTEELASGLTNASSWTEKVIDLPTDEYYDNVVIVFKGTSNCGYGDAYIYLDDVLVKENAGYAMSISGEDVSENTIAFGEVKNTSTTKTFTISNDGANDLTGVSVVSSDAEVFTVSDTGFDIAAGETKDITVTFVKGVVGSYEETITVSQANVASPIVLSVTGSYATPTPATIAVKLDDVAVGASVPFGTVGKAKTKTFTVANTGEATLNITSIVSSNTTDFTVSPASLEVAGGETGEFTVTFVWDGEALNAEKTADITLTNNAGDPVVFAVTGTRDNFWSEDFEGVNPLNGWENSGFTVKNQAYLGATENGTTLPSKFAVSNYSSTASTLITPRLEATAGDKLSFDAYFAWGDETLKVEWSEDKTNWHTDAPLYNYDKSSYSNGEYHTIEITAPITGAFYLRFSATFSNAIDNIEGFKLNENAPVIAVFSDAEATASVTSGTTKDFGWANTAQSATYYITNSGTGTLTISEISAVNGFTATTAGDVMTVAAGADPLALTITMTNAAVGAKSGTFTLTTNGGNFTIPVKGFVYGDRNLIDFSSAAQTAGWNKGTWTIDENVASVAAASTMQTTKFSVEANEKLYVEAKSNGSFYSSANLTYSYSTDNGENWTDGAAAIIASTTSSSDYAVYTLSDIADAEAVRTVLLKFTGANVAINRIYGFTALSVPVMSLDKPDDYNFGMQTEAAEYVITVTNNGTATLNNLAATLATGTDYSVVITKPDGESTTTITDGKATVPAGQQAIITVTQHYDADKGLASLSDVLTISGDDVESEEINLSGKTRDGSKLFVDFEDGNLPTGWTKGANWSVGTQVGGNYALSTSSSTATTVLTSPLAVEADEVLMFDATRYYSSYAPTLKVRYTTDAGNTWSDYVDYSSQINNSYSGTNYLTLSLTDVPAGTVIVEFTGAYIRLDNIMGFAPTTAPVLSLTESAVAVANGSTKEFGNLTEAGTATYTLSNTGTADLVSTVATTGVATAAITGEGEGVTISENTVTLAPGKSATITLTVPFAAPYGEKAGAMTISSQGWVANMVVNYTATTIDPTALYVDFSNNAKPAGWYNSGWTITSQRAANYSQSEEKSFITSLLTVEGTDDVLTFDAQAYFDGYTESITVSYSTDRKNWTPIVELDKNDIDGTLKTFDVKGLAAGNYYLKISGKYVYLDNIMGWHYKTPAPEHDLYVSSATFPTTTLVPEIVAGVNATATVYSLRANETGVYAKLFFDETEVATAEAQNISKDGSANFTLTGNVPATEKTYAAKIVVYYSDNSVAFETLTTDVEVAHTRTLSITEFTRDGEGEIDANASNQFSAAFNVTVQNTGSTAATTPVVKIFIGETEVGSATADAKIAAGESKEIAVNVTNASAGEGGELAFTAKAFWTAEDLEAKATSASDVVITVNAAAPKFNLNYKDGAALANDDNVDYGLVKAATSKTFTISNTGTKKLELVSIVAPEGYSATEVTEGNKNIAISGSLDIAVTLNADQGKKSGDLVITYKVDESTNKTFTLHLSGRSVASDTWTVAFDDAEGSIPANWVNENNSWRINIGNGSVYNYTTGKTLTTPRLTATAGEELTFDLAGANGSYPLLVEYSTDGYSWTEYDTYTTNGEKTFTAPAAGDYYIRFNGRYDYLSNFVGFKLATTVPVTISQYGYTTFASMSNINADELPDGIEVFYVKSEGVDGSYVRLTKAEGNIPAGTGLVLKGTANEEYNLNIATGATTALEGNLMVGCLENTELGVDADSYVLVNNTDTERAEFQRLDKQGVEIPAGKAYLRVAGAGARLMIFDDGETTGISSVLRQQARDGRVYNLNGQRVENPKKGQLYIINGKQTVVK